MVNYILRRVVVFLVTRVLRRIVLRMLFRAFVCVTFAGLMAAAMTNAPTRAQGLFSTNTPAPLPLILATNTPAAGTAATDVLRATDIPNPSAIPELTLAAPSSDLAPTPIFAAALAPALPQAPLERYAARLWTEDALVSLLIAQAQGLGGGSRAANAPDAETAERARALRLTQHELERRFPGAPRDPAARVVLLDALLNAPPGSVDARAYFRAYAAEVLNTEQPQTDVFARENWRYELVPLAAGGESRWLLHAQTAAADMPDTPIYETYIIVQQDADGRWSVLPGAPEYPAVPYSADRLTLEHIGDVTADRSDEIVLAVQREGALNRVLYLYNSRGEALTAPGETIRYGEIVDLPAGGRALIVQEYQLASPLWGCIVQTQVAWAFERNAFRPSRNTVGAVPQETLACRLAAYDPIFERPVADSISIVSASLEASSRDEGSASRAEMVLAVLYALNGERERALAEVERLSADASTLGDAWLAEQTGIYLAAVQSGASPLATCLALSEVGAEAACHFNDVFARLIREIPPRRDLPLDAQLNTLGAPPFTITTVSEVGRFPRQVVAFSGSGGLWQFAPTNGDTYSVEVLPSAAAARDAMADALTAIYATLIGSDDPASVLPMLDTRLRERPSDPELLFLRAFAYDLLSDRQTARVGYYAAWQAGAGSLWGQLAGAHLEQR